ncbi:transcription factor WhiB [Tessaracoccus sp. HDW20]|uniref:WhiB family transcriptional regulator n=1 Tax=Tessaracoccus coleopterorum TaxID=2714950 RepID=UPI0018D2F264|nr:WhiB family transcriptional regulator [Tessaracoccus coleopterorum]NHB85146.1 transcription factor WhiB [Tessaracoccus coleopterorum]
MTTTTSTACVTYANVFLHPLLDDGASPSSRGERREQQMLRSQADKMCAGCPLMAQCLSDAVTRFDVAGYVAGTTKRQRLEIRARLGVQVDPEDFDTFAGVNSGRQFDRYEIHRIRTANPDQPLSVIASKVGCSVSTVKRHLRRIEQEDGVLRPRVKATPSPRPSSRSRTRSRPASVARRPPDPCTCHPRWRGTPLCLATASSVPD